MIIIIFKNSFLLEKGYLKLRKFIISFSNYVYLFLKKLNLFLKLKDINLIYFSNIIRRIYKKEINLNFLSFKNYIKTKKIPTTKIFDSVTLNLFEPKIYPKKKTCILIRPYTNKFPEVYAVVVRDALLRSNTNIITVGEQAIFQDLYDSVKDYTSEEINGIHLVNSKKKLISFFDNNYRTFKLNSAASFLAAFSGNYAHWLTEILPKIATFCSLEKFKNVPLIVNNELHNNIMQSLNLVVDEKRLVYLLGKKVKVKVNKLYELSTIGYAPIGQKNIFDRQGVFSPDALRLMRDKIFAELKNLPVKKYPKKIYLKRNSYIRNLINEKEIIEILINKGFKIIETEKLSFFEQVSIIKNAKYITGPVGAAYANLIFASSGAKINILAGEVEKMPYWYWQNLAIAVNLKVSYILGKTNSLSLGVHSDFIIDPKLIYKQY